MSRSIKFNLFLQLEAVEIDDDGNETWWDLGFAASIATGESHEVIRALAQLPASIISDEDFNTAFNAIVAAERDFNEAKLEQ